MALVPMNELNVLRSADDARSTADNAGDDIQIQSIAAAINSASNTGEYNLLYSGELSDNNRKKIKDLGYTVSAVGHNLCKISWEDKGRTK